MTKQTSHPDRVTMLKALRDKTVPFAAHLDRCASCRETFALLKQAVVPGASSLEQPSQAALDRFAVVPLAFESTRPLSHRSGQVVFDSWQEAGAAAIRDAGIGAVRRLVLQAGAIRLEVVADRRADGWEFVARIYRRETATAAYVLRAGRRRVLPEAQGFYRWQSRRGPRRVTLVESEREIVFEGLSWL